jgi:hypothetical protein
MALAAASLLFATQLYAAPVKGSKSVNLKQTRQTGATRPAEAANFNTTKSNTYRTVHGSKSNNLREGSASSGPRPSGNGTPGGTFRPRLTGGDYGQARMGGGGGGKGASAPANATTVSGSKSNHDLRN